MSQSFSRHPLAPHRLLTLLAFAATAALLTSCSDDLPPEKVVLVPEGERTITFDDAGNPIQPPPSTDPPVMLLLIDGEDERTINVASTVELQVLLVDTLGAAVGGETIQFAIDGEADDAELSAQAAVTDMNGHAAIDLTGTSVPSELIVKAWGRETRVVEFVIHVLELPTGSIEVDFDYNGPVRLGAIEVYLVDDPSFCDQPGFLLPPQGVLESQNANNIGDDLTLGPLVSGTRVAVVARARLESNGVLAGGGCFGDLTLPINDTTHITIPLFLLPLNPAGEYQTINHFDFRNAIPGTLGDVVRTLVRFFGDGQNERQIAGVIFDLVEDLIRQAAGAIGGFVIDIVRGFIEDDLNDIINNYIDQDAPDWVRSFFTIGEDLMRIVANLEVISVIQLTKPRGDGTYDGSQSWVGLAFYWTLGCDGNPDPSCGRHPFTMEQVAAGSEGINLVFGQFTGRIHTYNQGEIDSHVIDLQYGRLILFVLNNLLLPAIADGAHSLREALLNLANCPAFANGITGGDDHLRLAGLDIVSRDTIEGWCTSIMGIVGDGAEAIIGTLRIDTRLTMSGHMTFVEESNDLQADKLEMGTWTGVIRTQNDQGPPFSGDFAGTRR